MTDIRNHIHYQSSQVYRSVRRRVLAPHSDRLFDLLYGDTLTVDQGNVTLEFDTSSLIAKRWFYPRYRDGSLHEPVVSKKFLNLIDSETVFFDVGANVGFYTVLASSVCTDIHAFEMDPRLASIISDHFSGQNGDSADIHVVPAAVGEKGGEIISFSPSQTENLSTNAVVSDMSTYEWQHSHFQLQTLALDEYVETTSTQPDVIKIDVEGFEQSVLEGLSSTVENVRTLIVEVHPDMLKDYGTDAASVLELLHDYGFSCQRFTDHRATGPPRKSLERIEDGANLTENGMLVCTK